MSKYDILFFDMDKTLILPDHFSITERTRSALLSAKAAGIRLAIASGRCLKILPQSVMELGFDYAITSNGASLVDLKTGEQLYANGPTAEDVAIAYPLLLPEADFIEFFADGGILLTKEHYARRHEHDMPVWHAQYFSQGNTPVIDSVEQYIADGVPGLEKIALVRYDKAVIARISERLNATGRFITTDSIGRSLEVNRADCTKGAAIRRLCELRGLDIQRAAAFGDGHNDIDMLQSVGCGIAMGNAKDSVKAIASAVTDSYEEDGVAKYMEKYIL